MTWRSIVVCNGSNDVPRDSIELARKIDQGRSEVLHSRYSRRGKPMDNTNIESFNGWPRRILERPLFRIVGLCEGHDGSVARRLQSAPATQSGATAGHSGPAPDARARRLPARRIGRYRSARRWRSDGVLERPASVRAAVPCRCPCTSTVPGGTRLERLVRQQERRCRRLPASSRACRYPRARGKLREAGRQRLRFGATASVASLVRLSSFLASSVNVTRTLIRSPSSASTSR